MSTQPGLGCGRNAAGRSSSRERARGLRGTPQTSTVRPRQGLGDVGLGSVDFFLCHAVGSAKN